MKEKNESRGKEELMLLLSLHDYYVKPKHSTQHTYITIH